MKDLKKTNTEAGGCVVLYIAMLITRKMATFMNKRTLMKRRRRIDLMWNAMNSGERYRFLRQWYPDCWAVNSMSLKKWSQLPPQFRFILRTNPR